jgi:hypothetical protein
MADMMTGLRGDFFFVAVELALAVAGLLLQSSKSMDEVNLHNRVDSDHPGIGSSFERKARLERRAVWANDSGTNRPIGWDTSHASTLPARDSWEPGIQGQVDSCSSKLAGHSTSIID